MNRPVSRALWAGTLAGAGLCAAASVAHALGLPIAARLARLGVIALLLTPPLRLVVTATSFWRARELRHALAATVVLGALVFAALRAGAL